VLKRFLVLALAAVFFVPSCALGKTSLIEKSAGKKPVWITKPPQDEKTLYFVGARSGAPSLGEGVESAVRDAMNQVMMTIGFTIAVKSEITNRVESNEEISSVVDQFRTTGQAQLKGQRVKEVYYEKYSTVRDAQKVEYYDVYVLLKYSDKEIKDERRRREEQQAENRRLAGTYMKEGAQLLGQGSVMDAYQKYADSLRVLSSQPGDELYNQSLISLKKIIENITVKEAPPAQGRKELTFKLSYATEGKEFPLKRVNAAVLMVMGKGETDKTVTTGLDGIGAAKIQKMAFEGGIAKVKIDIEPDQFLLPIKETYLADAELKNIKDMLGLKNITIVLKSTQYGTSQVCVIVWDRAGGRNKEMESMITEHLTKSGITVVVPKSLTPDLSFTNFDNPAFYESLSGEKISTAVIGMSEGIDNGDIYGLKSVTGKIDLRIVDIEKRQVITTVSKSKTTADISFEKGKTKVFRELIDLVAPSIVDTVSAE